MSPEGRDLVKQIMHLNPLKRLGMGTAGNDMDYEAMMGHQFFKNVDFL